MITKNLQKQAISLDPVDKIHLVEMILESLNVPNPEIEKAWVAESEARYGAYQKGQIKAVDYKVIRKKFKKLGFSRLVQFTKLSSRRKPGSIL